MNTPLFWVLVWFLRCVFGFLRAEKAKKKSRKRVARVSSGLALSFSLLALAAALGNSSRRPARAGRECQSCARESEQGVRTSSRLVRTSSGPSGAPQHAGTHGARWRRLRPPFHHPVASFFLRIVPR